MLVVKSIITQALTVTTDTLYDNPQVDMICMDGFSRMEPYYWSSTTTQALTVRVNTLYDNLQVDMTFISSID